VRETPEGYEIHPLKTKDCNDVCEREIVVSKEFLKKAFEDKRGILLGDPEVMEE